MQGQALPAYQSLRTPRFLGVNTWEPDERAALKAEIDAGKKDDTFIFVDCGANVGLYGLFVASEAARSGRKARIISVEPDPINLSRLRFNYAASGISDICIFDCALGDHDHVGRLLSEQRNRGEVRLANDGDDTQRAIEVTVRTLPGILLDAGLDHVDVIKLDIEGAEYSALRALFSEAPKSLWPSVIILEIGKRQPRLDAYQLCIDYGYESARRTRINVILRRPKNG
ncbi:MAG: FkbM family methyltransferase [Rhodomicrobium sp.]|nr:FkbM family methyltransferase [Rhodomicrobium sp.]